MWTTVDLVKELGIVWERQYTFKIFGISVYSYKQDFYRDR